MQRVFLFILILNYKAGNAQLNKTDVRDMAMGLSTAASLPDYGTPKNIAAFTWLNKSCLSFTATNKYFIKELSPVFIEAIKLINDNNALTASIGRIGSKEISQQFIDFGISKKLAPKFSAGIKIKYHQWLFTDSKYTNSNAFIPEAGLFANPLQNINFGVIVRNPVRMRMNAIEEKRLPAQIISGVSNQLSKKVQITASITHETNRELNFQAGIEYIFLNKLFLRIGYHSSPAKESFGFGLDLNIFQADLAFEVHPILGITSAISLNFSL